MTTSSTADGNDITAQPTVRSAWDAVKSEVTMLAFEAGAAACFTTSTILQAVAGHPLVAVFNGAAAGCFGLLSAMRTAKIVGTLKDIPAPKP